tara:strand:- start:2080 stop:2364 length:285 start_codon:yes stop_codon:yes gene_type:complete
MEFFIPGWTKIMAGLAAAGGAIVAVSLTVTYMTLFTIPAERQEAAKLATAEMLAKFNEASNELASDAEKFRARRLACSAADGVFDFATGDCRQG